MKLRLSNVERRFDVSPPTERTANGASDKFWVLAFSVNENLSTNEIEEYFAPENMSEVGFITTLINGEEYESTLHGYVNRLSSYIRHSADGSSVIEMQFSKAAESNNQEGA